MNTFNRLLGFLRPYKRALASLLGARQPRDGRDRRDPRPHRPSRRRAPERRASRPAPPDRRARQRPPHAAGDSPCVIVGVVLIRWVLTYFRRMIAGRVSLGIEFDLRELIYGHLQSLELGFFDHQQTGQLMSRATVDLQAVRFFLGYGLVFILQSVLTLLLAGAAMIVINPVLGLIAMAPTPFVVFISQRYGRRARPADPGGPAAHRRADRQRRGEHLRRARRQVLRARAAAARRASATASTASSPVDGRHAPGGQVQPDDRLSAPARSHRRAAPRRTAA